MQNKQRLYTIYRRIKNNCCDEWRKDSDGFYTWYESQMNEQKERCKYCHLPGCTIEYYGKLFRQGRRGLTLEVDRKDNTQPYSPSNCVLACYPCNNAKSDIFSYEDFLEIGQAISKVKKQSKHRGSDL